MEDIIAGILALVGLAEIYLLIYLVALPRKKRKQPSVLRLEKLNMFLALFFVMTLAGQFALNGPAYADNIGFSVQSAVEGDQIPSDIAIVNIPTSTPLNPSKPGAPAKAPVLTPGTTMELSIPKTGVHTPIVIPTDTSTAGVLKSLEGGVGVYPGSVLPGQPGHLILLGHSSRASWYHGDYAYVFSLLNKLKVGDEFVIQVGAMKYVYKIYSNQVFKPAAVDAYLSRPVVGSVVDLITCDPPGSAKYRRAVTAILQGEEGGS